MRKMLDKLPRTTVRSLLLFGLMASLAITMIMLLRPFFFPLFWATIIAIVFYPVYKGLNRVLGIAWVSTLITILLAIVAIFLPLSAIVFLVIRESSTLYDIITSGQIVELIQKLSTALQHTILAPIIVQIRGQVADLATNATKTITLYLLSNLKEITQNSIRFLFLGFILIYTLFFLLKDGERILRRLRFLSPLGDGYEDMLFSRFTSTVRATLKSTFLIGGIQGIIAAILFSATGVEGAFIWALLLFLFSMVPGVGSFVVWLPVGLIMLALGNVWQAVTIFAIGLLIISTIDNILRAPFIGKDIQMHPLLVFFSSLGGIFLFGISGVVIGPCIAALTLSVIAIYESYYLHELKSNG